MDKMPCRITDEVVESPYDVDDSDEDVHRPVYYRHKRVYMPWSGGFISSYLMFKHVDTGEVLKLREWVFRYNELVQGGGDAGSLFGVSLPEAIRTRVLVEVFFDEDFGKWVEV